jgi:hypothetical protein
MSTAALLSKTGTTNPAGQPSHHPEVRQQVRGWLESDGIERAERKAGEMYNRLRDLAASDDLSVASVTPWFYLYWLVAEAVGQDDGLSWSRHLKYAKARGISISQDMDVQVVAILSKVLGYEGAVPKEAKSIRIPPMPSLRSLLDRQSAGKIQPLGDSSKHRIGNPDRLRMDSFVHGKR